MTAPSPAPGPATAAVATHWAISGLTVATVLTLGAALTGWAFTQRHLRARGQLITGPIRGLLMGVKLYTREDTSRWRSTLLATLTVPVLASLIAPKGVAPALFLVGVVPLAVHARKVQRARTRITRQMFDITAAVCKYDKANALNWRSWVRVTKWQDLTNPLTAILSIPTSFNSNDAAGKAMLEKRFNGSVAAKTVWCYAWEPHNNRVVVTQAPQLPARIDWDGSPAGGPLGTVITLGMARIPAADLGYDADAAVGSISPATFDFQQSPHLLVVGTTGSGKRLTLDTRLPTPSGWTTMGEVRVGDELLDEAGHVCRVTVVHDVVDQPDLYRVTFSDGSTVDADADHLWLTETRQSRVHASKQRGPRAATRRPVLPVAMQKALNAAIERAGARDEITIREVAELIGVPDTTKWLRAAALAVGPSGERQHVTLQTYQGEPFVQTQTVRCWPARGAWTALASAPGRRLSVLTSTFTGLACAADADGVVTAADVRRVCAAGGWSMRRPEALQLLKRVAGPGETRRLPVTVVPPTRTVTKATRPALTYPTKSLLTAVLEHGSRPWHDQRHLTDAPAVRTTAEIRDTLIVGRHANHSVRVAAPLELPETYLPVGPYTLGAWLGDGISRQGAICGIDQGVADRIESEGYTTHPRRGAARHPDFRVWRVDGLRAGLAALNLLRPDPRRSDEQWRGKHIPATYLRSSIAQRRALLAGLLDTDGSVAAQGTVVFSSSNETLANDVRELCLTLGYRATIRVKEATLNGQAHGPTWTVSFTTGVSPFGLTRKTNAHAERNAYSPQRNDRRYITAVSKIDSRPARCISVDSPNRLFLCGDAMIPTHNSVAARLIIAQVLLGGWDVTFIDPKRVEGTVFVGRPGVKRVLPGGGLAELEQIVDAITEIEEEMKRRYSVFEERGLQANIELPEGERAMPMMLVIDEAFELFSPSQIKSDEGKEIDALKATAFTKVASIARLGRAANVHLMLCTQRPDATVIRGELKQNLPTRIACGPMDPIGLRMAVGEDMAAIAPEISADKGRARFGAIGLPVRELQIAWIDPSSLDLLLPRAPGSGPLAPPAPEAPAEVLDTSASPPQAPAAPAAPVAWVEDPSFAPDLPMPPAADGLVPMTVPGPVASPAAEEDLQRLIARSAQTLSAQSSAPAVAPAPIPPPAEEGFDWASISTPGPDTVVGPAAADAVPAVTIRRLPRPAVAPAPSGQAAAPEPAAAPTPSAPTLARPRRAGQRPAGPATTPPTPTQPTSGPASPTMDVTGRHSGPGSRTPRMEDHLGAEDRQEGVA